MNSASGSCSVLWLGPIPYEEAWELQRRLAAARARGSLGDLLLLLEHPPTYTLGRSGLADHLLVGQLTLEARGARVFRVDRGGDVTYHGPGQLVGYPILSLRARGLDVHAYLRSLEEVLRRTLQAFGIGAQCVPGLTGLWVGPNKIAAIGIRVARGITSHGFALNVNTDLFAFDAIIPCGLRGCGVTSMAQLLGLTVPLGRVVAQVTMHFAEVFGCPLQPVTGSVGDLLQGEPSVTSEAARS